MSKSETNKKQEQQQQQQQQPGVPLLRVAILGAGYSGLSLANLLLSHAPKKHDNDWADVVLIEALHPPTPGALVGNVRVPNAKLLFQRLGWSYPWGRMQEQQRQGGNTGDRFHASGENQSLPTTSTSIVPEDELIQALRRPVESKIWHRHVCCQVEAAAKNSNNDDDQLSLLLTNRETETTFRYPHAIDVLVICTGASSSKSIMRNIPSSSLSRCIILVLGDARASIDVLGQHRIRQGANQAMQDAMDVSEMLLLLSKGETLTRQQWGRFGLRAKRRAVTQVWIFFVLIVAILACLVRYQNKSQ
jgi:2-polyprenyl-6-methoxyphenol hydroxylase-like FAD-dependent oxidoreductase